MRLTKRPEGRQSFPLDAQPYRTSWPTLHSAGAPPSLPRWGRLAGGALRAAQRPALPGGRPRCPRGRPRPVLGLGATRRSPRAPPLHAAPRSTARPNAVQNSIYWPTLQPRPAPPSEAQRSAPPWRRPLPAFQPSSPPTTQQPAAFSRPGLYILNSDGVRSPPPCEARPGRGARGSGGGGRAQQSGRAAHGVH